MAYSASGLRDPDTSPSDLVIGARYSKDNDWFDGMIWNLRVWERGLGDYEMWKIFEMEKHLLGYS